MSRKIEKILIANRSEIAVRVINACQSLGIKSVAVYSDADKNAKHKMLADEAIYIGEATPQKSYLDIEKIINAAKETNADAIHPGYGFLAENPQFAIRCSEENIIFIGPSPEAINLLGNKVESRIKMEDAGIPLIPGMKKSETDITIYKKAADECGYPVMVKAAAGGGGKGMRVVHKAEDLKDAVESAKREAKNAFNDDTVYLEKFIVNPRHIEFQILADTHGNTIHLFERECSIQRRHQKIIEETPSVAMTDELRQKMGADAVRVAQAANYVNAGTVEFLLDETGHYYFLEMNTRIQVEHPITEMVTSTDLVVEQIRIAQGESIEHLKNCKQSGHAIECRIYAEDGENNFMPSIGEILHYTEPSGPGVRVDSGVQKGTDVTVDYDPIMAKLIVHAPSREIAISKMIRALHQFKILGVKTSKKFMVDILTHDQFIAGNTFTDFIEKYMNDRNDYIDEFKELAVATAAVCSSQTTQTTTSNSKENNIPTPWKTLGAIQIGDSIHE